MMKSSDQDWLDFWNYVSQAGAAASLVSVIVAVPGVFGNHLWSIAGTVFGVIAASLVVTGVCGATLYSKRVSQAQELVIEGLRADTARAHEHVAQLELKRCELELKLEHLRLPRVLTAELAGPMVEQLRPFTGEFAGKITVFAVADSEAQTFARQCIQLFRGIGLLGQNQNSVGQDIQPIACTLNAPVAAGLMISYHSSEDEGFARQLAGVLDRAGFPATVEFGGPARDPAFEVEFFVLPKR